MGSMVVWAGSGRCRSAVVAPNAKRETTVVEEKLEGIRRDAKRSDGFLEVTTEGLAFHDVLGDEIHLSLIHPKDPLQYCGRHPDFMRVEEGKSGSTGARSVRFALVQGSPSLR